MRRYSGRDLRMHSIPTNLQSVGGFMSAIILSKLDSNDTFQSDTELVSLARQNDRDAFGRLISRHYSACVRLATFVLRNRGEAEEEVQNACLKAYEHLDQYHGDAGFE